MRSGPGISALEETYEGLKWDLLSWAHGLSWEYADAHADSRERDRNDSRSDQPHWGGLWVAKVAARLALGFDQGVYRVGLIVNNRRPVDARSPRVEMGAHT